MGTYRETPRHVPFFMAPPCALGVRQKAQAFRAPGSFLIGYSRGLPLCHPERQRRIFQTAPPCALGVRQKAQAFRAPGSFWISHSRVPGRQKEKILRPFGAQNDREKDGTQKDRERDGAQNDRKRGALEVTGEEPGSE